MQIPFVVAIGTILRACVCLHLNTDHFFNRRRATFVTVPKITYQIPLQRRPSGILQE
jgi:hypothetical protein